MYHGQSFVNHTLESEVAIPKQKRKRKLEQGKLCPSSASWILLQESGHLPEIEHVLDLPISTVDDVCKGIGEIASVMDLIRKNCLLMNEGHSVLLCGTLLPHIVEELNDTAKVYKFSIYPVVKRESGARENKRADFTIFKIQNRITRVVIEAKLNVSQNLNNHMKDDLAQLFLEAQYADQEEGNRHNTTLCALTDGLTWHFFVVNMRAKPLEFAKYLKADKPKSVYSIINYFLKQ